jgi:hypothetical protein
MKENSQGHLKKWMAFTCHYCPLCRYGRKNPESFLGKLLHHKSHADHCPFWKAEKEAYGHK